MERKFLEDLGLDKEVIDKVLDKASAEIGTHKATITQLTTERDGLKTQLTDANKTIDGFKAMDIEAIKKSADEWKTKAEKAEGDATAQIAALKMDHAISEKVAGIKFTSDLAKDAVVGKVKAANLKLDETGALLGFDDLIKGLREKDAGAFATEENGGGAGVPYVAGRTGGGKETTGAEAALRAAFGLPDNKKE